MMKKTRSLLACVLMLVASPLAAQERTVLVELFTSQGCSACPPADKLLHELAARDDVVALALHVDIWDYIGWKDSFARPENTKRQRAYAQVAGRDMIYTPQMIIDGADDVMGTHPEDVSALIRQHKSTPRPVDLEITRQGDMLSISARAKRGVEGTCTVRLARYRPRATVDILRGENAGRTLTYANVVTEMTRVAEWDMREPLTVEVALTGELPAVVIVQRNSHGPVQAVAQAD
ncbi:DUF1223 domain-containing protein [Roseovarius salis]|uniref:DUF1223 domain-containing protein n=1 Tax=Roseovarius salis TaxID=3376063 RepID=UPI0037C8106D